LLKNNILKSCIFKLFLLYKIKKKKKKIINLKFKSMFVKNELLKNEVLKNGVERKYIKLYFGSRWEEEIDDVVLNDKIFDVWYNDFKNECIENDYEYIIDEFGRYERNDDRNIVVLRRSDDSEEWYVEYNKGNVDLINLIKCGKNRGKMIISGKEEDLEDGLEIYLNDK